MKNNLKVAMNEYLTDRQKQILTMYYFEEKTMEQIAKELYISKPCVSITLKRAKNNLKKIKKFM
ncbi:sigma-70 family RNA polymerase sigma factor [Tepidibacter formicigenes]|jgi:RNA polymerase sigma factor (sigma-70 family)|nr:sigma-70 family RNA polymerase sigma factor [Tepidibacter formicigenes]